MELLKGFCVFAAVAAVLVVGLIAAPIMWFWEGIREFPWVVPLSIAFPFVMHFGARGLHKLRDRR